MCFLNSKNKGETIMKRTVDELKIRIHMLKQRDPIGNANLIRKLERRVRAMGN